MTLASYAVKLRLASYAVVALLYPLYIESEIPTCFYYELGASTALLPFLLRFVSFGPKFRIVAESPSSGMGVLRYLKVSSQNHEKFSINSAQFPGAFYTHVYHILDRKNRTPSITVYIYCTLQNKCNRPFWHKIARGCSAYLYVFCFFLYQNCSQAAILIKLL